MKKCAWCCQVIKYILTASHCKYNQLHLSVIIIFKTHWLCGRNAPSYNACMLIENLIFRYSIRHNKQIEGLVLINMWIKRKKSDIIISCYHIKGVANLLTDGRTKEHTPETSQWCHNERHGVSNQWRRDWLFNRLFKRRSKKKAKLRATVLCEGNPSVTRGFPSQRASNAENVSIWWRHHETICLMPLVNGGMVS